MIFPKTIKYYERVTSKSDKGQVVNTFPVVSARFQGAVKPLTLTSAQAAGWSETDLAANSKFMAYPRGRIIRELDRIVDSLGGYYEIRGVNAWTVFPQALLVPVQGENAPVSVDGVSISPTTLTIAMGSGPHALTKTLDPVAPTNPAVTWSSSSPSKATVDSSGHVTPVAPGVTNVTVTTTDGGFTATCIVTVIP